MAGATRTDRRGRMGTIVPPLLVGLGALLVTVAIALAFVVVPAQKVTPLDTDVTTVTDTVDGAVLEAAAYASGTPTATNQERAECRKEGDRELPVTCFIDNGVPMYSQRHVTTVDPSDSDQITLQAAQTVLRPDRAGSSGEEGLVTATIDRVTLDRTSSEPVADAPSTMQLLDSGQLGADSAPKPFTRQGLQYKFPFGAEKKDYQYFDASTFTDETISFKEESEVGGVHTYVYEQKVGPLDMWASIRKHFADTGETAQAESVLASYRIRDATAERWGLPGDPQRKVDMRRYYTVTRTLNVEPDTGLIVDGREDIHQFFAENQQQADAFFADKAAVHEEVVNPQRTAFRFAGGWNSKTIGELAETAQDGSDTLNTMGRVLPAVLGLLGLLSLAGGVVLGLRDGRSRDGRVGTTQD